MLPGFRFLFAAIALSVSILIFGLGAAALLRAAHEEFASNPTWRAAPEPRFAQQSEPSQPVLAVLRVEPQPSAQTAPDPQFADVPASLPSPQSDVPAAPAEPEAAVAPAPEAEKVAALTTQDASPLPEPAKTDPPSPEGPMASDAAPAPAEETKVATAEEAKLTAIDASPGEPEAAKASTDKASTDKPETDNAEPDNADIAKSEPAKSEPAKPEFAVAPPMAAIDPAATRVATLGGPPVATETGTPKKDAGENTEQSLEKARLHAQARARARRRLAARARLARQQQAAAQQQPLSALFGQPGPTPARMPEAR